MKARIAIFIVLCALIWAGAVVLDSRVRPQFATQLSINALNGGDREAADLRTSKSAFDWIETSSAGLTVLAGGLCFGSFVHRASGPKGK